MAADGPVTVQVELTIGGQPVQAKLTVPQGSTSPRQLLPIMQGMANLVVSVAEMREVKEGRKISCAAGCGPAAGNWCRSHPAKPIRLPH